MRAARPHGKRRRTARKDFWFDCQKLRPYCGRNRIIVAVQRTVRNLQISTKIFGGTAFRDVNIEKFYKSIPIDIFSVNIENCSMAYRNISIYKHHLRISEPQISFSFSLKFGSKNTLVPPQLGLTAIDYVSPDAEATKYLLVRAVSHVTTLPVRHLTPGAHSVPR